MILRSKNQIPRATRLNTYTDAVDPNNNALDWKYTGSADLGSYTMIIDVDKASM